MISSIMENMETISLKQFSEGDKILLLKGLGLQTDGKFVLKSDGEIATDKYLGIPVQLNNMLIFPGSTIVLDDNELSITLYLEEYGDNF